MNNILNKELIDILNFLSEKHRPILVGGCVRDFLLGIPSKDIDVEVHGITYYELSKKLELFGKVDLVGKSFGVIKLNNEYDFSIPRKETKSGVGHKGFDVSFDNVSIKDAFKRRDFTFNAIGYDWKNSEYIDFFGGIGDLRDGQIRHINDETFVEDSLRILRAMQFQCRFGFSINDRTMSLIKNMVKQNALDELPIERISEEWRKWAVKGNHHHLIFDFLEQSGIGKRYFFGLINLKFVPQDFKHHPEGNVENHTKLVLQEALQIANREELNDDEREVLIYSALLHDIGKNWTTKIDEYGVTAHGHESAGLDTAKNILIKIGVNNKIIEKVLKLIELHMYHINFKDIIKKYDNDIFNSNIKKFVLKLQRKLSPATINELVRVIEADASGRHPLPRRCPDEAVSILNVAKNMDIDSSTKFKGLVTGKHLIEWGYTPSYEFKTILEDCIQAEIDKTFGNIEGAEIYVNSKFKK